MTCICKQKYLEAFEHYEKLQNAIYDVMHDAYGEEIANLLFFADKQELSEENLCQEEVDAEFFRMQAALEIISKLTEIYK